MLSLALSLLSMFATCETVGPRLDGTAVTICDGTVVSTVEIVGPTCDPNVAPCYQTLADAEGAL